MLFCSVHCVMSVMTSLQYGQSYHLNHILQTKSSSSNKDSVYCFYVRYASSLLYVASPWHLELSLPKHGESTLS